MLLASAARAALPAGDAAPPAAWLRRAALDITGRLPTTAQLERLEASPTPKVRAELVDELVASPAFSKRWGRLLAAPLVTADRELNTLARRVEEWVAACLARREPWPQVVREMVTAEGSLDEAPGVAFLLQFIEARQEVASRVGTGLLGIRLQCAQCHDHPFARWTVEDFHGLAAWFARTRRMDVPRELYRAYRDGRQRDLSFVDVALPRTLSEKAAREKLEKLGRDIKVLQGHAIGGPARNREKNPVEMELMTSSTSMPASLKVTDIGKTVAVLIEEGGGELAVPDLPAIPGTLKVTLAERARRAMPPRIPQVGEMKLEGRTRRQTLAAWLTDPANPYLARALVNRVWSHLFGRGLVEPVDAVDSPDDPARASELASWSTRFAAHPEIAALVREVVLSPAYLAAPGAARPLDAGQIAGALESGLGMSETGAVERVLARQTRERADDGSDARERATTPLDLPAALSWIASEELDRAIARSGLVARLAKLPAGQRAAALTRALLARDPTAEESARFAPLLADPAAPAPPALRPLQQRLADAAWAVVASAEFLSQR